MRKFLLTNLEQDAAGHWRWTINLPALTAALAAMEANPLAPADRFAGAALFITGDRSPYVGPGDHAAIRAKFPAARIEILPSGHNPHTEAREAFVALVAAAAQ
jgi:pimeloyl-ACP methyl ester carboxylesterase